MTLHIKEHIISKYTVISFKVMTWGFEYKLFYTFPRNHSNS